MRNHSLLRLRLALPLAFSALIASAAPASVRGTVVLGPQGRNTSAPTGALADAGWQYEGGWQIGAGTTISPNVFVTGKHLGGSLGQTFDFQGQLYTAVEIYDSAFSDLRMVRVDGTFPEYAPLYTSMDEVGKDLTVFGRGLARGPEFTLGGEPRGWTFGGFDGQFSWGTNTVSMIFPAGGTQGDLVGFQFNGDAGPDEAFLALGDSGGGVFLQDNGVWKLAGVNYAITSPYSLTGDVNDPGFAAALYDTRGLYLFNDATGQYELQSGPNPVPGTAFATRISTNLAFLNTVVPEPGSFALVIIGASAGAGAGAVRYRRRLGKPAEKFETPA